MFGIDLTQLASLPVLLAELGVVRTLVVGARVQAAVGRGEPFDALDPPENERERLSREQIAPAILLYRELLERMERDEALRVVELAVVEGAVAFLKKSIGKLERARLEQLDDDERRTFVERRGEKFFNATVTWDTIEASRVHFTVTHCRFPGLCADVGHPELAPVFCAGDAKFFGTVEPDVVLDRPATIAGGDSQCLFRLQWSDTRDS